MNICLSSEIAEALNISGNDWIVFSIIYGFSGDGESKFSGSIETLAKYCRCSTRGVQKNLISLVEKGFIIKEEKQTGRGCFKYVEYSVSKDLIEKFEHCSTPILDNIVGTEFHESLEQSSINYTVNSNILKSHSSIDNINNNILDGTEFQRDRTEFHTARDFNNTPNNKVKRSTSVEKLYMKLEKIVLTAGLSEEVTDEILRFVNIQLDLGNKIAPETLSIQIGKLSDMSDEEAIASIQTSISNGWKAMVYDKKETSNNKSYMINKKQEVCKETDGGVTF